MKNITLCSFFLAMSLTIGHGWAADASPENSSAVVSDDDKFAAFLSKCRSQYAETDERIDHAGVRDAGYYRIPGFPYLRTDRLMSSYRDALIDLNTLGTWMLQLRENDSIARDIELTNLGMPKYERAALLNDLRVCAVWLSYADLDDAPTKQRLLEAARVPDEYADGAPKQNKTLREVVSSRRAAVVAEFSRPLNPVANTVLWHIEHPADEASLPHGFSDVARDELGRVGLLMNVWPELAAKHAPQILLETESDHDALGTPVIGARGPAIDTGKAVVYYLPGYARVNGRTLVQLEYFVWFPTASGELDGLIWRVTLDERGEPLLYDTIRGSGFDPLWFPAQALKSRKSAERESLLIPQVRMPVAPFALRLQSASHVPQRLIAIEASGTPQSRSYELRPYEDLLTLPMPEGGTRSLFDADGIVLGTEPTDSHQYEAMGVKHAGALRQWGRHAISLQSRLHFDDPRLIESLFDISAPATQKRRRHRVSAESPATP